MKRLRARGTVEESAWPGAGGWRRPVPFRNQREASVAGGESQGAGGEGEEGGLRGKAGFPEGGRPLVWWFSVNGLVRGCCACILVTRTVSRSQNILVTIKVYRPPI